MKCIIFTVLLCTAASAAPWTAYIYTANSNTPAVVKIDQPGLTFPQTPITGLNLQLLKNIPRVPSVGASEAVPLVGSVVQMSAPLVKSAVSLVPHVESVPQAVVKSVSSVPTSVSLVKSAPVAVSSIKTVSAPISVASVSAPAFKSTPAVVVAAPEPLNAPEPPMPSVDVPFVGGQFHAQDENKQYTFGHWGGPNTRVESGDLYGRVSGSFSYVNPNGHVQVRKYSAAPNVGFKVAASDLPMDTPAVAQVKAAHAQAHRQATTL